MKRVVLSICIVFLFFISFAQVPQGFNYQAIARDGTSGDPLINTPLEALIAIQDDSLGNAIIWEELHTSITTNDYGMFSLYIGKGTRQGSSTVQAFNDINWGELPKYINARIYYDDEWHNMGSTRFWSVPYSMVAGNISDTLNKLFVKGETTDLEEPLFQVKNKDGQIIFAVYNEGVRVYVADGDTKGKKGGFAIGGFGAGKADDPGQEYFVVSRDSIRAYIYDDPLVKRAKGGFAIGGFGAGKGFTNDYLLISPDSARVYVNSDPSTKAKKGGFAIGGFDPGKGPDGQNYLTVSNDSIRMYIDAAAKTKKGGFAIGGFDPGKGDNVSYLNVATDATGIINPSQNRILWYPIKNAFLAGRVRIGTPDSVGQNSMAIGYESKARGEYSQSMGYKAIANGDYSTAIGKNALANNINSFALGENAHAINDESYAIGRGAVASGYRSFAFGSAGVDNEGNITDVSRAIGDYSFAIGQGAQALDFGAFAIGTTTQAVGRFSSSFGLSTIALGTGSTSFGWNAEARGSFSTAMGWGTLALDDFSVVLGTFNDTTCQVNGGNPAFSIGNGNFGWLYPTTRTNAFTVYRNGYTAIGHSIPTQMLDVNGNARFRSIGSGAYYSVVNIMSDGTLTTATSDISFKDNINTIRNSLSSILDLRGVTFTWKTEPEMGRKIGFIAQEVEKVIPELVFTNPEDGFKGVNYAEMSAVLVEAMKEQQQQIEAQQKEIDELKTLIKGLIDNQ